MGFWDKEQELAKVEKKGTKSSFYSFKLVSKNGREMVDVREHFEKIDGTIQHTAKGMSIPLNTFTDMMVAFRDVNEELRDKLESL